MATNDDKSKTGEASRPSEKPETNSSALEEGQAVEFEVTQGAKGKQAANVRPV